MADAVFTIVTPTVGRQSLLRLKDVLKCETVPYIHLILFDDKRCDGALDPGDLEDARTFCYELRHPLYAGKSSRTDVWLRAVGLTMARTPYIKCCDDDTWPEANHLERVLQFMQANGLDFTYCLRRMWTRSGELIGIDRFEAIGDVNRFGYRLLDNSSLFYNRKAAAILREVFLTHQFYGDDRYTYDPLAAQCKGMRLDEVLTNHMAQPELENFFRQHCSQN